MIQTISNTCQRVGGVGSHLVKGPHTNSPHHFLLPVKTEWHTVSDLEWLDRLQQRLLISKLKHSRALPFYHGKLGFEKRALAVFFTLHYTNDGISIHLTRLPTEHSISINTLIRCQSGIAHQGSTGDQILDSEPNMSFKITLVGTRQARVLETEGSIGHLLTQTRSMSAGLRWWCIASLIGWTGTS